MLLLWILLMIVAIILEKKRKLSQNISILLLMVSVLVPGVIFAASPNPVIPIQMITVGIKTHQPLSTILPMVMILILLLLTSLFFGRIFCSYACPLGSFQELISKIFFKSKAKKKPSIPTLSVNGKLPNIIRFVFFLFFIASGLLWGTAIIQYLNPFTGFQIFRNPVFPIVIIPFIEIVIIGILSLFIYRPWCRFLCPFGFLASFTAKFGIYKLHRTDSCTDCKLCEKICPTDEAKAADDKSECYLCNRCVEICPVNAITFGKKNQK